MTQKQLSKLAKVTELAFQREYERLRPILLDEARILGQLAQLDSQMAEVRTAEAQSQEYLLTGADLMWHSWEATARRRLNIELARARAQKLDALDTLRQTFGRKQAVASLAEKTRPKDRLGNA